MRLNPRSLPFHLRPVGAPTFVRPKIVSTLSAGTFSSQRLHPSSTSFVVAVVRCRCRRRRRRRRPRPPPPPPSPGRRRRQTPGSPLQTSWFLPSSSEHGSKTEFLALQSPELPSNFNWAATNAPRDSDELSTAANVADGFSSIATPRHRLRAGLRARRRTTALLRQHTNRCIGHHCAIASRKHGRSREGHGGGQRGPRPRAALHQGVLHRYAPSLRA